MNIYPISSQYSSSNLLPPVLVEGSELMAMDEGGTSDPYCKFRLDTMLGYIDKWVILESSRVCPLGLFRAYHREFPRANFFRQPQSPDHTKFPRCPKCPESKLFKVCRVQSV